MGEDEAAPYRGYEVTVFIPDAAPGSACERVADAVADACFLLEDDAFKDRVGWDLSISGGPADHQTEAAFARAVDECATALDVRDEALAQVSELRGQLDAANAEIRRLTNAAFIRRSE